VQKNIDAIDCKKVYIPITSTTFPFFYPKLQ